MAIIHDFQPLDPVLEGLSDEIKAHWRLHRIADALPGRLNLSRGSVVTAKSATDEAKWGLKFLTHLRDLSTLTKGKDAHDAVKEALGDRIETRRASENMFREQWTILADLQYLLSLYGPRPEGGRRSPRLKKKYGMNKTHSIVQSDMRSPSTVTTPEPDAAVRSSRKRKDRGEPETGDEDKVSLRPKKRGHIRSQIPQS